MGGGLCFFFPGCKDVWLRKLFHFIIFIFLFAGGLERLGSWQDEGRAGLIGPGAHGLRERAFSIIRAILLFSPPPVLQQRVLEFYSRTFSVYMSQMGEQIEPDDAVEEHERSDVCTGCAAAPQACWCQNALEQLQEFSHIL